VSAWRPKPRCRKPQESWNWKEIGHNQRGRNQKQSFKCINGSSRWHESRDWTKQYRIPILEEVVNKHLDRKDWITYTRYVTVLQDVTHTFPV
jgi:hypothetical protein